MLVFRYFNIYKLLTYSFIFSKKKIYCHFSKGEKFIVIYETLDFLKILYYLKNRTKSKLKLHNLKMCLNTKKIIVVKILYIHFFLKIFRF